MRELRAHTQRIYRRQEEAGAALHRHLSLASLPGCDDLFTRKGARKVIAQFGEARWILLDFIGVERIGSEFADEIFNVFCRQHPDVRIQTIYKNKQVSLEIDRAVERRKASHE